MIFDHKQWQRRSVARVHFSLSYADGKVPFCCGAVIIHQLFIIICIRTIAAWREWYELAESSDALFCNIKCQYFQFLSFYSRLFSPCIVAKNYLLCCAVNIDKWSVFFHKKFRIVSQYYNTSLFTNFLPWTGWWCEVDMRGLGWGPNIWAFQFQNVRTFHMRCIASVCTINAQCTVGLRLALSC